MKEGLVKNVEILKGSETGNGCKCAMFEIFVCHFSTSKPPWETYVKLNNEIITSGGSYTSLVQFSLESTSWWRWLWCLLTLLAFSLPPPTVYREVDGTLMSVLLPSLLSSLFLYVSTVMLAVNLVSSCCHGTGSYRTREYNVYDLDVGFINVWISGGGFGLVLIAIKTTCTGGTVVSLNLIPRPTFKCLETREKSPKIQFPIFVLINNYNVIPLVSIIHPS